jgi:tripartite-type tricarboxylate transporter receptor subunit TctC
MDSAKQRLLGEIIAWITLIVAGCPDGSTDVMTRLLAESNRVRCDVHLKFAT